MNLAGLQHDDVQRIVWIVCLKLFKSLFIIGTNRIIDPCKVELVPVVFLDVSNCYSLPFCLHINERCSEHHPCYWPGDSGRRLSLYAGAGGRGGVGRDGEAEYHFLPFVLVIVVLLTAQCGSMHGKVLLEVTSMHENVL